MTWDETRIAQERVICDSASPGPWVRSGPYTVATQNPYEGHEAAIGEAETWGDTEFIAHARTVLPEALDVIAIARAYVDAVSDPTNPFDLVDARWRAFRDAMNGGAS